MSSNNIAFKSHKHLVANLPAHSLRAPRGALPDNIIAGANALSEWISSKEKDYELVAQQKDSDGEIIDAALEIVKQFIIDRGLILFGGLAIDYALRLKGSKIYPDIQRPDFDCISTRSVNDAYDLADILHKAGFESVGAIRGIHIQTMKVRTNFIWVADIGYTPPNIFNIIPTFDYQGMKVVHPDYQRMDMHFAFCFPFSGAPREVVFHRWEKDLNRFNLIEKYYPIIQKVPKIEKLITKKCTLSVPIIGKGAELTVALHGFAAYSAIRASLDELIDVFKIKPPTILAPKLSISYPNNFSIAIQSPINSPIVFASPFPKEAIATLPNFKQYRQYMDVYPESYKNGNITMLSTKERQVAAAIVRANKLKVFIVSPQYLLVWFLVEAQLTTDINEVAIYRSFYLHVLEIIKHAEQIYFDIINSANSAELVKEAIDNFTASPFAPVLTTLGNINHDSSYIIRMAGNSGILHDTPPKSLNLDTNISDLLVGLPINYYPAKEKPQPVFSYDINPLFARSGQVYEPFDE